LFYGPILSPSLRERDRQTVCCVTISEPFTCAASADGKHDCLVVISTAATAYPSFSLPPSPFIFTSRRFVCSFRPMDLIRCPGARARAQHCLAITRPLRSVDRSVKCLSTPRSRLTHHQP